jgi:hypothetical protein
MILQDANNIMKVVKGILVIYTYNKNPKIKSNCKPYKINEKLEYYSINYQIDDQIFKITI